MAMSISLSRATVQAGRAAELNTASRAKSTEQACRRCTGVVVFTASCDKARTLPRTLVYDHMLVWIRKAMR